jgi:hypothetical protein
MIALTIDMVKMRLDSPKDYLSDNYKDMPDLLEINSSPMVRFLDSDYSIDTLIKWLTSRGIVIPRGFSKLAEEVKSWMSELKPQDEAVPDAGAGNGDTEPKDRELTAWLREAWVNEGMPGGTAFFNRLKKHTNQKGSPIIEHYSAGKDAGIKWKTSAGTAGEMKKKTIQTKVSTFKRTP